MSNLLLITRPINRIPVETFTAAYSVATEVALIQNGVYNNKCDFDAVSVPTDHRPALLGALDTDATGRAVLVSHPLISMGVLVDAISRNDKTTTI
jgi:hypothetical protein